MNIYLVSMPYADLQRPPAAMGLLHALLQKNGLTVRSFYANLLFGERIGSTAWNTVGRARPQDCLGDWTFSHIAFPDHAVNLEQFAAVIEGRIWGYRGDNLEQIKQILAEVREAAGVFVEEAVEEILSAKPQIVACSSTFSQHVPSLALLRGVKHRAPEVVTMMGGANCEGVMGVTTHRCFEWVDYVVCGEADAIIVDLVKAIEFSLESGTPSGGPEVGSFGGSLPVEELPTGVLGHAHRLEGYPRSASGPCPTPFKALDELPVPDYDDYFATLEECPALRQRIEPSLPLEASRGCWWGKQQGCTFCGLNGENSLFRSKSAQRVLQQMESLGHRYGINRLEMTDNILNPGFFNSLLPELKRRGSPYKIFWETRSNLDRRQTELLKDAGVIWIQPGMESLHSSHLALMNKGCQAWENIQLLKYSRQNGLRLVWFILNGLPGEEDSWFAEMARRVPLLTHLQPPQYLIPVLFTRFSQYHHTPQKYGLSLTVPDTYAQVYPLGDKDLERLAYFFEDRRFTEGRKFLETLVSLGGDCSGIGRLRYEMARWVEAFRKKPPPVLEMRKVEDGLKIIDTRPVASRAEHILNGVTARIYETCDQAPTLETLSSLLKGEGAGKESISASIECLVEKKLMARVDDRLISLAVRHPAGSMPDPMDYPCGLIK